MYIFNCMKLLLSSSGMKDSRSKVFVMYFFRWNVLHFFCVFNICFKNGVKSAQTDSQGTEKNFASISFRLSCNFFVLFSMGHECFLFSGSFFIDKFIFCRFYCSYSNKTNKNFKNISFFLLLCLSPFKKHKNGMIIFHE